MRVYARSKAWKNAAGEWGLQIEKCILFLFLEGYGILSYK